MVLGSSRRSIWKKYGAVIEMRLAAHEILQRGKVTEGGFIGSEHASLGHLDRAPATVPDGCVHAWLRTLIFHS